MEGDSTVHPDMRPSARGQISSPSEAQIDVHDANINDINDIRFNYINNLAPV